MSVIFDDLPEARPRPKAAARKPRVSPSPTKQIAANKTFANYELTETILSHLDLEDLVTATEVSTQWHEIILTSKNLRTRLLDERIPRMISNPETLQKQYNIPNGHYWFFRIQPSSLFNEDNKFCVVIYRTPTYHIELLVSQHEPKIVVLNPARTRLFGSFAGSIWRVDGYDVSGEVVWKDLCGVYCESSVGLCSYCWRYLLPTVRGGRDALQWTGSMAKGMIVAYAVSAEGIRRGYD